MRAFPVTIAQFGLKLLLALVAQVEDTNELSPGADELLDPTVYCSLLGDT